MSRQVTDLAWMANPCSYGVHVSRGQYQRYRHVELISEAFRRAALTPGSRLLIITPPRIGKSTTCSCYGPAWYLTAFPERRVLFGSYAAEFSADWSQRVRDLVAEHGGALGTGVGQRGRANNWTTLQGGGMRSSGVGSRVAGLGANLIVFDDTVGSAEDALSENIQEKTWQWWLADFTTRRESVETSFIGIGTRWTERDLMGRLLAARDQGPDAEGYEPWEVLYLPAIRDGFDWTGRRGCEDPLGREDGEVVWPERWPLEFLERERAAKPWWFAALHMGRPEPLEGGKLKQRYWSYWQPPLATAEDDLGPVYVATEARPVVEVPQLVRVIISVDTNALADVQQIKKGREPADTAIHGWGLDADGRQFILDREAGKLDLAGTASAVQAMVKRLTPGSEYAQDLGLDSQLAPPTAFIEAKANGPAVIAKLRRRGVVCVPVTPLEGKIQRVMGAGATEAQRAGRATAFADAALEGRIHLPHPAAVVGGRNCQWSLDLRHKFAQWPRAGLDDTDAASQAWAKLAQTAWAAEDQEKQKAQDDEAALKRRAGLPQDAKAPRNVAELVAARHRATVAALERRAAEQRTSGGRVGRRTPWEG